MSSRRPGTTSENPSGRDTNDRCRAISFWVAAMSCRRALRVSVTKSEDRSQGQSSHGERMARTMFRWDRLTFLHDLEHPLQLSPLWIIFWRALEQILIKARHTRSVHRSLSSPGLKSDSTDLDQQQIPGHPLHDAQQIIAQPQPFTLPPLPLIQPPREPTRLLPQITQQL